KGFDSFCPLGPCIATDLDPSALSVEGLVNGVVRQSGSTKDLIFPVEDLVARVSEVMTLVPGDVIATGTPAGAGRLQPGDRVEIGTQGRVNLIERLAGQIAQALLREFPAEEVRVRVRKLTPPLQGLVGTPSVELTRRR